MAYNTFSEECMFKSMELTNGNVKYICTKSIYIVWLLRSSSKITENRSMTINTLSYILPSCQHF